jgi:hypothetical protein
MLSSLSPDRKPCEINQETAQEGEGGVRPHPTHGTQTCIELSSRLSHA